MSFESEMLEPVSPTDLREDVEKASSVLVTRVSEVALCFAIDLEVRLVGSVAKDTFVGDPDIDVFIRSQDTPRAALEKCRPCHRPIRSLRARRGL